MVFYRLLEEERLRRLRQRLGLPEPTEQNPFAEYVPPDKGGITGLRRRLAGGEEPPTLAEVFQGPIEAGRFLKALVTPRGQIATPEYYEKSTPAQILEAALSFPAGAGLAGVARGPGARYGATRALEAARAAPGAVKGYVQAAARGLEAQAVVPVKQAVTTGRKAPKAEEFFVHTRGGWKPVEGRPVTFKTWPDEQFFVHRDVGGKTYVVSEVHTGTSVVSGELTAAKAVESARAKMATMAGEKYRPTYLSAKEARLKQSGESPRFAKQPSQALAAGQAEMPVGTERLVAQKVPHPVGGPKPYYRVFRPSDGKLLGGAETERGALDAAQQSLRVFQEHPEWDVAQAAEAVAKAPARTAKEIDEALGRFEATLPGDIPKPAIETEAAFVARRIKELKADIEDIGFRLDVAGERKRLQQEYRAAKPVATTPSTAVPARGRATEAVAPKAARPLRMPRMSEETRPLYEKVIAQLPEEIRADLDNVVRIRIGESAEGIGSRTVMLQGTNVEIELGRGSPTIEGDLLHELVVARLIKRPELIEGPSSIFQVDDTAEAIIRRLKAGQPLGAPKAAKAAEITEPVIEPAAGQLPPTGAAAPTRAGPLVGQQAAPGAPAAPPPAKPPVTTGDIPSAEPILPRPRTLTDMNREAKGMRAMTPEQRAAVMDLAEPIKGDIMYQARPFNEHAANLLGPDSGFNKALRGVPGLKQAFGAWNPAQMARDNPIAMIGLRQSIFQEIEKARIRFVTLRWWHDADAAFAFKRSGTAYGLKPTSGVWKATNIKPATAATPKGKMFGTINDIIEHPERYALTDDQRKVLSLADNTLTQSVRDAQRAGVNVVELAEAYWPRIVTKGPKGAKGFGGVRKGVSSAKGYTHQRVFSDIDDLVEAGFEVETDPRRVFASRLEAGVDTIAHQNSRRQIMALPGVKKPLERMAERYPEVLQTAQSARVARDAAKKVVVKAGAKATPGEVTTLRQAEADYISSMREVFAKKVEAGTPGYYELRLPNGRIAPQELVDAVGKFVELPELRQPGVGAGARLTREISQLMRTTLTNVDLAAGYIQGQTLFYRNNIAWWKAQGHSVVSLIDDPVAWVAKNYDAIDEGVRAGAIVAPTEFLFAKQGIASIPLRIPYAGPALGSFNRAFEWFITTGQTELYKAARSGVLKNAGMDDLVSLGSAIRKEVGTESYAILGVRPTQRTMEALTLFAARFFRANVGVLGQAFTRGPGGAEARKALGSLLAGGTTLTIGIKWAQDKELPNMTDPYAPDWMQFKLGKTYFNTFGPFYPYFRTLARMSVALADGNAVKAATEAKNFLESKESLPLRALDIAGQLIYYGTAHVYGTKIEKTWTSIAKGILGEFVTPISIQEIPSAIAEGRPEQALESVGLIGRPIRLASEWAKDIQPYLDTPANVEEIKAKRKLDPSLKLLTRSAYRTANPEVDAKLFIVGEVDSFQTGDAFLAAVRLMKEHGIGIENIKSLEKKEFESPSVTERRANLERELGVAQSAGLAPATSGGRMQMLRERYGMAQPTPVGAR